MSGVQSPGVTSLEVNPMPGHDQSRVLSRASIFTQSPDIACSDQESGKSLTGGDTRDREMLRADAIILGHEQRDMPACSDMSGSDFEDCGTERGETKEHDFYLGSKSSLSEQLLGEFSARFKSDSALRKVSEVEKRSFLSPSPVLEPEVDKSDLGPTENVNIWIQKDDESVPENANEGYYNEWVNHPTGLSMPLQGNIRRKPFRILSIADGHCISLDSTASELLKMVRTPRVPGMDYHRSGCLKLRDLRQICSSGVGSQRPSIEPRRSCVLVNMPQIRALILRNRVLLIALDKKDDGVPIRSTIDVYSMLTPQSLRHCKKILENNQPLKEPLLGWRASFNENSSEVHLGDKKEDQNSLANIDVPETVNSSLLRKLIRLSAIKRASPFEFLCLEAVLFEVISKMSEFVNPAYEMTEQLKLQKVQHLSSTEKLHQIRELKRFLQDAESAAEGVANSLTEILENEEDVRRLEVSRFSEKPSEWDEPSDSPGAEDAEILLESYQQDIESIVLKIRSTDETLDTLLQIMQLQLATTRNLLLKFEIALQVLSVVIGLVSAVAGIFGMNITNGYEERGDVFWIITRTMVTFLLVTGGSVMLIGTRLKL